jgi:hypothetical protein
MIKTSILMAVTCACLQADTVTIVLDSNNITTQPNGVGSWTFQMQPDASQWVSVTSSFLMLETNPGLGLYTDEIGLLGGPNGRLAPGGPNWTGTIGYYQVDGASLIGDLNQATLRITYELFSADPATCGSCLVSSSFSDHAVSVEVAPAVPEPGTWATLSLGAGLIAIRYLRGRRSPGARRST